MNTAVMLEAIKDGLQDAGAENVFTTMPRHKEINDIFERFQNTNREFIHYWYVRRIASLPDTSDSLPGFVPIGCKVRWMHRFEIMFNVAFLDADENRVNSEIYFNGVVDAVLTATASKRTWGGAAWNSLNVMELANISEGQLGNEILTHEAMFLLSLIEFQDVTFS